jgi:predicted enzyme related to lactoylglutathione lyase
MTRSIRFYRDGLGLPHRTDKPPVVYFELPGTWLALFPRADLAAYAGVAAEGVGFSAMTLACNVPDRSTVDQVLTRAEAAGGCIVRPAHELGFGGYGGWFADPDEHLWEVIWNPRPFIDSGR